MGLVFIPLYIDYLGMEAWGLVGFMAMMQAWMTLLDMGLTSTVNREMALFQAGEHSAQSIRDLLRSLELIMGGIAIGVAVLVWLAAPFIARHWLNATQLSPASLETAVGLIGLVLASRMAEQIYRGAIQGLQRQDWLNGMQSLLATIRAIGAIGVLAWIDSSIEAYFLWQGCISLLTIAILVRQTYAWLPLGVRQARFAVASLDRIRHFAGGMAATSLLALLLTQVDKLLLSTLVPLEEFGYYTLAASIAGILGLLVAPVGTAVLPHLVGLVAKSDQEELVTTYHATSQWLSVLLIPTALVLAAFAEPLLFAWSANQELARRSASLLSLLSLGTLLNSWMQVPYMAQLAYGWTGLAVRVNMLAVCGIVPAILWFVPRYGVIAAAWAWLALNVGYIVIAIQLMHRKILAGEQRRWYRDAIIKPLAAGMTTVFLLYQGITMPQGRLPILAVLCGIGALTMLFVLLSTSMPRTLLCRALNLRQ